MIKKKVDLKDSELTNMDSGLPKKVKGDAFEVSTKEHGGALPFSKDRNTKDRPLRNSPRIFPNLNNLNEVEISLIDVDVVNVRTSLDEQSYIKLRNSIKKHGLLQPIIVYKKENGRYSLKYGNTRLKACSELGWEFIPVHISDPVSSESEVVVQQLAENNDRNDLSYINTCQTLLRLKEQLIKEGKPSRQNDIATLTGMTLLQVKDRFSVMKIFENSKVTSLLQELELYGFSKDLFDKLLESYKEQKGGDRHLSDEMTSESIEEFYNDMEAINQKKCGSIVRDDLKKILAAGKDAEKGGGRHLLNENIKFWSMFGKFCTENDRIELKVGDAEDSKDEKAIKATEALQKYMKTILKAVKNIKSDIDKMDSSMIEVDKLSVVKIQELQKGNSEFADALISFDDVFASRNIELGLTKQFFEKGLESLDEEYIAKMISKWTQRKK
jgi:ParB family chromosome partitioning protein